MENYYYLSASIKSDLRGAHCTFEIALSGATMLTLLLVCAFFSPRKYESILRGFYNAVSLPGDCHATLAMTKSALHGKTQAFASNRRTPTCGWVLCPLKRTRSQYRMDVDGQNETLTGLLTAHTALLKSHYWSNNAHSFVCVRLFPTGTQYPAGSPITALLRYIAKRHKVTAKTNTLHNARKRKRFPNANLWLGSLPRKSQTKNAQPNRLCVFVGGR